MRACVRAAFSTVKEELDDHREAINENSNELLANYEYLVKIEGKLDKLSERIDGMQLAFEEMAGRKIHRAEIMLTRSEQKIFLLLYTLNDAMSCVDIAARLRMREDMVSDAVLALAAKGVSVVQEFRDAIAYVRLDNAFKEMHAKNNIVKIDLSVALDDCSFDAPVEAVSVV